MDWQAVKQRMFRHEVVLTLTLSFFPCSVVQLPYLSSNADVMLQLRPEVRAAVKLIGLLS